MYHRYRKGFALSLVLTAWIAVLTPRPGFAQASVAVEPEARPVRDSLGWRLGLLNYGLLDSGQGRPFLYFDAGLRYKTNDAYIDVKAPFIAAGVDLLFYALQGEVLGIDEPFNLFEALNEPIHYGAFLEVAQVRLGQTYTVFPFRNPDGPDAPLRMSLGILGLADFVFFDLALANQDPDDFEGIDNPSATDPIVAGLGGFVALGGDAPSSEYDIAIGVARDLFNDSQYVENNGWVIFGDLEIEIDVSDNFGTYIRWRTSLYTHVLPTAAITMALNYGVVARFF